MAKEITKTSSVVYGKHSLYHFALIALIALSLYGIASLGHTTESSSSQKKPIIVALGDSLTAGYGLDAKDSFPAQLEAELRKEFPDIQVINAGISGNTADDGLARLDQVLAAKPHLVIVALGENDALRHYPTTQTYQALARILDRLKQNNIKILLAGMKIPYHINPQSKAFESIYPRLAKEFDVPLMPFFLEDVALKPSLNLPDGIHPNAQGIRTVVKNILPFVKKTLAQK